MFSSPPPKQWNTPNVFWFLYVNGCSLCWKLLHYQLWEPTWARRQRDWIPNNCVARKVEKAGSGWVQPLKGSEHLDKHIRRVLSLHYWMSQIVFAEHQDVLSYPVSWVPPPLVAGGCSTLTDAGAAELGTSNPLHMLAPLSCFEGWQWL